MKLFVFTALILLNFFTVSRAQQNTNPPIFVSPYQQNETTYISSLPNVVRSKPQQQQPNSTMRRTSINKWEPYDMRNPLEGTSFGRITREIDYYDSITKKYHNQYDYMSLLAQRGNLTELQNVATYLQTTGVFDPAKYQAAMQAARNGTTLSAQITGTALMSGNASNKSQQQSLFTVQPQSTLEIPQKIHRDYNDDSQANKPIFIQ